ncbi:MAG: hypothetical protein ABFD77_01960 [Thermotogota bacterium]
MLSALDLIARLERRARRVRGASWAAKAWAAAAILAVVALLAATLWTPASVSRVRTVLGVLPGGAALLAYSLGRRARPPLPELLLAVDERLGLEARLSALYELTHHAGPAAFASRIAADVDRRAPQWQKGIPIDRRSLVSALVGAAILAAGFTLVPLVAAPPAATPMFSEGTEKAADAASTTGGSEPQEASAVETATDSSRTTELPARSGALRDILAELRPSGNTPSSPSANGSESEGQESDLRRDLERLSERLDHSTNPLNMAEEKTLRDYVASQAPDRRSEVDDAVAASDLDALRQTIHQLIAETAPIEKMKSGSAVSQLAPDASPPVSAQETPSSAPPPTAAAPGSDRTGGGTLGDGSTPQPDSTFSEPPPVFESSEVGVLPVSPPSTLGPSGAYSEYLTAGVPVEPPQAGATTAGNVAFSFDRIDTAISGRDIPDGAVDTIRTYFERITEENP